MWTEHVMAQKSTLDTVYKQMDDMIYCSKASISEWQKEQEFQEEIEAMVIRNYIRSVQEEFEGSLWDHNAQIYGNESTNWHEKMKEISNLRQELDAISKILSAPEVGQLTSHGSLEIGEEWSNNKMTDHFHRNVLGNHVSSTSLWEGTGKHEESIINIPELDPARLKHMSKDELMKYYSTEITKMKRNHESELQEMAEEYFSLKRKFMKERESSLPLKKVKEFDILRKKIPEAVSKLDDILVEYEKLPFIDSVESLGSLKDGLNNLRSENCQLRDLLTASMEEKDKLLLEAAAALAEPTNECEYIIKKIAKFECRVVEDTKRNDLRLENLGSQLSSLIQKANTLRRQGLLHKHRLERKSSNLQKAEAEVDLLGDEVDTLLSLLKKIYIGLDHYSPILQHYPGMMEILKMVRRELSGESTEPM